MPKSTLSGGPEAPATPCTLSWQATDALRVIQSTDPRPGAPVDVCVLRHRWERAHANLGNAPLWQGLRDLVDAGVVEPFTGETVAIFITEEAMQL